MKKVYYSMRILIFILVFIVMLLWLDITVFHSNLWIIKGAIYVVKETQLHTAKVRAEDYKIFYIANKDDLLKIAENNNINSSLPYKKENIQIDSLSCGWLSCEFKGNDNYILVYNRNHYKTLWEVIKKNATFIVTIIDNDWYVLAPCSRFTCNESQLR